MKVCKEGRRLLNRGVKGTVLVVLREIEYKDRNSQDESWTTIDTRGMIHDSGNKESQQARTYGIALRREQNIAKARKDSFLSRRWK